MANVKITDLPAIASVALADVIPIVDDVAGTPATTKATITQLRAALVPIVLTTDVSGVLPKANQGAQDMGGDCSGSTASCTVAKVNGITCTGTPAAGAVLRATSASAAAWGQLDLADTDAVTGVLPKANQGAQDLAGDVTGNTGAAVVAKVNGITCTGTPAAGAVLRATSASAAAWGQLDLADTDAVTGVLPTGNVATTLTGKTLTTATLTTPVVTNTSINNANTGAINNCTLSGTAGFVRHVRFTNATAPSITGFDATGVAEGTTLVVFNDNTNVGTSIAITSEDTNSTDVNRVTLNAGLTINVPSLCFTTFMYLNGRWRGLGASAI